MKGVSLQFWTEFRTSSGELRELKDPEGSATPRQLRRLNKTGCLVARTGSGASAIWDALKTPPKTRKGRVTAKADSQIRSSPPRSEPVRRGSLRADISPRRPRTLAKIGSLSMASSAGGFRRPGALGGNGLRNRWACKRRVSSNLTSTVTTTGTRNEARTSTGEDH